MEVSPDDVWSALANPLRRRILDVISERPATTGAIVTSLQEDRHVVMQHLRVLRHVDLVRVEPRGRERLNHLNPVPLQDAVGRWISRYEQHWAAALIGLRDTLEAQAQPNQAVKPSAPTTLHQNSDEEAAAMRRTHGA
jgi:DNA-binding transcriptional ArsR family regulator